MEYLPNMIIQYLDLRRDQEIKKLQSVIDHYESMLSNLECRCQGYRHNSDCNFYTRYKRIHHCNVCKSFNLEMGENRIFCKWCDKSFCYTALEYSPEDGCGVYIENAHVCFNCISESEYQSIIYQEMDS